MAMNNIHPWYEIAWDVAFTGLTDHEILTLFQNQAAMIDTPNFQIPRQLKAHKQISEDLWADIVQGKVLVHDTNGLPVRNSQLRTLPTRGPETAHITADRGQMWLKSRGYQFDWKPKNGAASRPTSSNLVNIARTKRRDPLTSVIEQAQRECNDPHDTSEVWNKLSVFAHKKVAPFFGVVPEGLQWDQAADIPKLLTKNALRKRLARQSRPMKARPSAADNGR